MNHFSGSHLEEFWFFDCSITDCVFTQCHCRDWRLWGCRIADTSFRGADLPESALGGVDDGKRNSFRNVDFTEADLRETAFAVAEFMGCRFDNSKLNKGNFDGSSFTDCGFEGELREVCFNKTASGYDSFPPNQMVNVDLSRAVLRSVEFRKLDLDQVRFPDDENHITVDNYGEALDRTLAMLRTQSDPGFRRLTAVLAHLRKWTGAQQRRGVINVSDLVECGGEERAKQVVQLLRG